MEVTVSKKAVKSIRENLFFRPSMTISTSEGLLHSFFQSTLRDRVREYHLNLSGSVRHDVSSVDSDVDWIVLVFQHHEHTLTLDELHAEFCEFLSSYDYQPVMFEIQEREVRIVTVATPEASVDFCFILATGCAPDKGGLPSISGQLCDNISASMYNFWRLTDAVYKVLDTRFTQTEQESVRALIVLLKSFQKSGIHPPPHVRLVSGTCHYLGGIHIVTMVIAVALQVKHSQREVTFMGVLGDLLDIWGNIDSGKKSFCVCHTECEKCKSHKSCETSGTRVRVCGPLCGENLAAYVAPVLWDVVLPCWASLVKKEWGDCLSGKTSLQEFVVHVPHLSCHLLGYDHVAVLEEIQATTESDRRAVGAFIVRLNPTVLALPQTDQLPAIACQSEEGCHRHVVEVRDYVKRTLDKDVLANIYHHDSVP
jgi:hypothetical protein